MKVSLTSDRDIPSVFRFKTKLYEFAKYELYGCTTVWLPILILKTCIRRCDGPERHEMLTVLNDYYGCTKCFIVPIQIKTLIGVKFKVQHLPTYNPLIQVQ